MVVAQELDLERIALVCARRGRRPRRRDDRGHGRRRTRPARADCCSRSRASSAACRRSKRSSGLSTRTSPIASPAADGDRCRAARRARAHLGPHARGPHRRAHRAQPARPPVRHRDADAPLRRRGRGHRRGDPRHAQDDARACGRSRSTPCAAAAARTTASASTTGSSSRTTTCAPRAASGRPSSAFAQPEAACRSRSRPRRSTTCARRSPPARTRSCSTTCRRLVMREAVAARRWPGEARGLGRRHARHRPRDRRDRRRLHLGRRADPFGPLARRLPGGLVNDAPPRSRRSRRKSARSRRARAP